MFLRAHKPDISLLSPQGLILPAREWTAVGGVAALALHRHHQLRDLDLPHGGRPLDLPEPLGGDVLILQKCDGFRADPGA